MKFSRGDITQEMKIIGATDHTGTEVVFKPDPEMFEDTEYDYETLHTRMREEAFLNAGLTITIADRRGEETISDTMCYAGGIREFVSYINRNKTPIHDGVIYMAGSKEDAMAEVSLQYNRQLQRDHRLLCQQRPHPRGGHARGGLQAGPYQRPERLRPADEDSEGRREGHRRGLPGGASPASSP